MKMIAEYMSSDMRIAKNIPVLYSSDSGPVVSGYVRILGQQANTKEVMNMAVSHAFNG